MKIKMKILGEKLITPYNYSRLKTKKTKKFNSKQQKQKKKQKKTQKTKKEYYNWTVLKIKKKTVG